MKKILKASPLLILVGLLFASHENIGITTYSRSISESGVGGVFGVEALFINPAGLSSGSKFELLLSYEIPYGNIKGLKSTILGFKYSNFAIGISEYFLNIENEGKYAEGMYLLSYGRNVGVINVGGSLNIYKFQDPRFGTDYKGGIDLGIQSAVSDFVSAGVFYKNITRSAIRGSDLPQYLDTGITISIQGLSSTYLSFRMYPGNSPIFMLGEEVSLADGLLQVKGGLNYGDDYKKASFGLEINLKGFIVGYAFSTNFELSPAHSFSINFRR
ncbi:MAG: hypothetical protein QMD82_02665 [bacterium]|nr:hypothetical protein [bacterium]